ncbi:MULTISPECIES: hypothetical protein [Methylobacillus]|uniref:Uncharacterized protein n=1 Tax=Methylobacillus flagellatus (strain ATCC 51484 / DSM 6875 / VKM B-1610 / KT) TaxID=265072 RepID=Q1GZ46_METFK|nr:MULTISPECIES: hypothetical protein [Methylobacillus]ABE50491.1 hypothetical protein Mfla_2224 [Methylobacillus flagellatus KT]MPS49887.1 hypothetical protein [Methylobacillus sp.]
MMSTAVQTTWDTPVVCRVEVDLSGWLEQLTGKADWEVYDESEDENYMSFAMRHGRRQAEVTLYHNGYATVDVDGESVFDGSLTTRTSHCAHLSYYHAENGEPITLN